MKNLKDYFSSPKSLEVSLNDSVNSNQESPVENGSATSKRKSKKSLSSKSSKRKRLSEESSAQSSANTSQNSTNVLDETIEEFDVVHPKSSKKKRKPSSETASGKSLSLKKRKSIKNVKNLEIKDDSSPQSNPQQEIISIKHNFLTRIPDKPIKTSATVKTSHKTPEICADNEKLPGSDTDKTLNISTSIKGNFFEKVKEKINKNSENNVGNKSGAEKPEINETPSDSGTHKSKDNLSTSIKGNFFDKVSGRKDGCDLDKKNKENELPNKNKNNFFAKFTEQINSKNEKSFSNNVEDKSNSEKTVVKDEQKSENTSLIKKRGRKRKVKNNVINEDEPNERSLPPSSSKIDAGISSDIIKINDENSQHSNNDVQIIEESSEKVEKSVESNVKRCSKFSENSEEVLTLDGKTSGKKRKRKRKSNDLSGDEKNNSVGNGNEQTSTPENRRSLFNYFNKVDKSAVAFKSEEKRTIKVEVEVHEPRSSERSEHRPLLRRKAKKNRKQPDFDLITSEEDCSIIEETPVPVVTPKKPAWKMRINIQSPGCHGDFDAEHTTNEEENVRNCENRTPNFDNEVVFIDETSVEVIAEKHGSSTPAFKDDSDVLIVGDESNSCFGPDNSVNSKTPSLKGAGTLAAYFGVKSCGKKDKKPEERSLATKMFLQSPAPPSLKKIVQQNNSELMEARAAPFPVKSHIMQKNKLSIMWNLPEPRLKFKPNTGDVEPSLPEFSGLCHLSQPLDITNTVITGSTKSEINMATKHLKEQEMNVPIKKWLENLRALKKVSGVGELWTDKYQPKSTDDVLIQTANVSRLNEWLATFETNLANGSDSESSGDEFVNDKDEKVSKSGITALLVGPPGVGKTAAVYAAAKQNGYQVLELNASCNRNGKKVYHEFSEATQSHKVETKSLFKSKSKKKEKLKKSNKKSLILIEDSDLIFNDLDDGYVNCLSQLQSSSKRPLVLVANDTSKHLTKLLPSSSSISLSFHRPPHHTLGCFLKSVSLVEGNVMTQEACDLLIESTKGDIRKSINNLQFYGPLYNQLDRRKLGLFDENACVFSNSSFNTKDEALDTVQKAKNHSIHDLLSFNKDCGKFSWLRESTAIDPRDKELMFDFLRSDISQVLASNLYLPSQHQSLPSHSKSLGGHEELNKAVDLSFYLKRRAFACDYSSSLREMARAERLRLLTQTKRNKRYFNHLHNLGVDTADQNTLDILCSTFADDFAPEQTDQLHFDDIPVID